MADNTLQDSIITVSLLKFDYFMSSFPGKIVFGEISRGHFAKDKHYVIYRCEFCQFYEAMVPLLKSVCTSKDDQRTIIETKEYQYIWETK